MTNAELDALRTDMHEAYSRAMQAGRDPQECPEYVTARAAYLDALTRRDIGPAVVKRWFTVGGRRWS